MRTSVNPLRLQKVYRQLSLLLSRIYPPRCTLCDAPGFDVIDLCPGCYDDLPWNRQACIQCALPLTGNRQQGMICGNCLKPGIRAACDQVWSAFIYKCEIPWLITHLKFHNRLNHARVLGELMWLKLEGPLKHHSDGCPDIIMPVPLHTARLHERGFNQALEIARPIARGSGIRLDTRSLKRTRNTRRQSDLSQPERQRNLKQAFTCNRDLKGLHIVLVDDVMTSGNTINAAALALKNAGARRVSAWVSARAALQAI